MEFVILDQEAVGRILVAAIAKQASCQCMTSHLDRGFFAISLPLEFPTPAPERNNFCPGGKKTS